MAIAACNPLHVEIVLIFVIIASVLLSYSCEKPSETTNYNSHSTTSANIFSRSCIDVEGKVFGDIIPYSAVALMEISNFNLSDVLVTIQSNQPIKREYVNTTGGFKFSCLSSGKFAFVIPTTSYYGPIGYPLPYEFDCRNFSLRIAFQGGNSQYAIGAFEIMNASAKNRSECTEYQFLCLLGSGGLYRACHLEFG